MILILDENDLSESGKLHKTKKSTSFKYDKVGRDIIHKADAVIYLDKDGSQTVLKNRYDREYLNVLKEQYEI